MTTGIKEQNEVEKAERENLHIGRQFSALVGDVTAMWAPLENDLGPDPFTDAYESTFPDDLVSWQYQICN